MTIPSFSLFLTKRGSATDLHIKCIYSRRAPLHIRRLVQVYHPQLVNTLCKEQEREGQLTESDGMREVMWVQNALQDRTRTGHADLCQLGAQEVDGAAVERVERVSARNGALFHERFLGCEECRVEFALGWGERAVYGEGTCCVNG
jgi:hypothetical protein